MTTERWQGCEADKKSPPLFDGQKIGIKKTVRGEVTNSKEVDKTSTSRKSQVRSWCLSPSRLDTESRADISQLRGPGVGVLNETI